MGYWAEEKVVGGGEQSSHRVSCEVKPGGRSTLNRFERRHKNGPYLTPSAFGVGSNRTIVPPLAAFVVLVLQDSLFAEPYKTPERRSQV